MSLRNFCKLPYRRVIIPDAKHGYTGLIDEFPGCIAEGETLQEVYDNLERAAESWIEAALSMGQEIPEPVYLQSLKNLTTPDHR